MDPCLTLVLIVLLFWYLFFGQSKEEFKVFNKEKVDKMTKTLMRKENMDLFRPDGQYSDAATKIHWIDPVTYYDLAKLHYNNTYTEENVRKMFE